MDRLIRSKSGSIWMDVTDRAKELFNSGVLDLYEFYETKDTTIHTPIRQSDRLLQVLDSDSRVCLFVGMGTHPSIIEEVTVESWQMADKISHNGFIYVKYSDLRFCR